MPTARIYFTLPRLQLLSSIPIGKSIRLYPMPIQGCRMQVFINQPNWCVYVKKSIVECLLWVCHCFTRSYLHIWQFLFGLFARWEISGLTTAVFFVCCWLNFLNAARRIHLVLLSKRFIWADKVHLHSSVDTERIRQNHRFISW